VGLDFFEASIEIEKLFGVRLEPDHIIPIWQSKNNDCTVGDLHDIVSQLCLSSGLKVPRSSRNRIRLALARALAVSPRKIDMGTWLRRDLDFI
jgi:hypothetical protein